MSPGASGLDKEILYTATNYRDLTCLVQVYLEELGFASSPPSSGVGLLVHLLTAID